MKVARTGRTAMSHPLLGATLSAGAQTHGTRPVPVFAAAA